MVFISETKQFICIGESFLGKKNNIYICKDETGSGKYMLCAVKDHRVARRLTEYFEEGKKPDNIEIFSARGMYCIAIPYKRERSLKKFILTEKESLDKVKEICRKVVFECMSSKLPWPVLYLVLKNEFINIDKEGDVYFTYCLDLAKMRRRNEADCVSLCGEYLEMLLEDIKFTSWSGYRLLKLKNKRMQYTTFNELYQDIYSGTKINKKDGILKKIKYYIIQHKDAILRVLKVICIIIGITALIFFIADIIFGENPLMRLFINTFKRIGTESMLQ